MKAQTIVILGMHRSGTSLTSAVLKELGVNMGPDYFGKMWSNPIGHHEDGVFVRLNDEMLKAAGGSWHTPPSKKSLLSLGVTFDKKILSLIHKKGLWGWKDPRTALTISLYHKHLVNPKYVFCTRTEEGVARSLLVRGDMSYERACRLRKVYEARIRSFIKDKEHVVVSFDVLRGEPEKVIKQLVLFLDITPTLQQRARAKKLVLSSKKLFFKKCLFLIMHFFSYPKKSFQALKRLFKYS